MCSGVVEIWLSTLVRFRLLNWPFLVSLEFEKKRKTHPSVKNIYSIFTLVRPGATLTKHLKLQRKKAVNVL